MRVGLVSGGRIVRLLSEPLPCRPSGGEVLGHIESLIAALVTPEVTGIGIGVPSVVDAERGIVAQWSASVVARGAPQGAARTALSACRCA